MKEKKTLADWVKMLTSFFHRTFPEEESATDGQSSRESKCCSFTVRRNIVNALHEIKRFAEENNLPATMIRALLTLLAELALGALKGKISTTLLDSLMKMFNQEAAIAEAYARGEIAGRNARIEMEYFPAPESPETVPFITRRRIPVDTQPTIFKIAKGDE